MALKAQSARTPVAGTPTTVVPRPLAGIPPFGYPSTKNAFSATTSVPSLPLPDTISAHAVILNGNKAGHQVSPAFASCPPALPLLRWNQPSSTPQLYAPALRLEEETCDCPPEGHGSPASQRRTTKGSDFSNRTEPPEVSGHCTNFTEISYEKTRRRYEQSAIHEIQLRSI